MPELNSLVSHKNLTKLTIPQLKTICKENGIKVSSKLNKDAIISAIASSGRADLLLGNATETVRPAEGVNRSIKESENLLACSTQGPLFGIVPNAGTYTKSPPESSHTSSSTSATPLTVLCPSLDAKKRKAHASSENDVRLKQFKATDISSVQIEGRSVKSVAGQPAGSNGPNNLAQSARVPSDHDSTQVRGVVASKCFTPATVNLERRAVVPTVASTGGDSDRVKEEVTTRRFIPPRAAAKCTERLPAGISIYPTDGMTSSVALVYLDFPPICDVMQLQPLPLPLPPFRRKDVEKLAIVFASIPPRYFHELSQVSRLFRCAVYTSAGERLKREFSGRRLALLTRLYDSDTTNMWPYLRRRQKERFNCQDAYAQSFLWKIFSGKQMISDGLWASPDHGKQATVAVRFLLTRLFFHISVGCTVNDGMQVTDAQELVKGEIWSIKTLTEGRVEVFYVLEATCEVIGQQPPYSGQGAVPYSGISLRVDWSAYINQCMSQPSITGEPSLIGNIVWTNHEEYFQGISKLWVSRTQKEGEVGAAKRLVAERYILACVFGNSISGQWMSSTEMAQEFQGLPDITYPKDRRRKPTLNLFLPAHHHVESVHFETSSRQTLHPALAVVQTPGREYYVLKDNGMEVGCEESGIALVWTQLLGCDTFGRPADTQ